jgi:hypothetical protein
MHGDTHVHEDAERFYRDALGRLMEAKVPFLVGGAYAFQCYTGIARNTKDIDIFVHRRDAPRVLALLADAGYRTEMTFPHWLGKAFGGGDVLDVIFSSGNGLAEVDEAWFEHAVDGEVLGLPVKLSPVEEMIWSKAFIMERERFDGADVIHLLRARADRLDWARLLARFGANWRPLFAHLVMFGFVYPGERARIPNGVMRELLRRLESELRTPAPTVRLCQGTLISREQYLADVERWGYEDARLLPHVAMSTEDIARWTDAIQDEPHASAGPKAA